MKIIDRVELKHFRSFLGTPQKYETNIDSLKDLNIFSGANDSGKSNILRALNLFFNDEIAPDNTFEFNRDFFQGKKDATYKVIEIAISFDLSRDSKRDRFLPERFKITKYYDRNGFRNYVYCFKLKGHSQEIKIDSRAEKNTEVKNLFLTDTSSVEERKNADKREWVYRVKFSGFLNKSISFQYIPAIRDKGFFARLFGRVITQIKQNEDEALLELQKEQQKINNWEDTLTIKTEKKEFKENIKNEEWRMSRLIEIEIRLMGENRLSASINKLEEEINQYSNSLISSIDFLSSEFKVGKDLQEFFEGFDVGTGENKSISFELRGDGVQAKYVPKILDFLSKIDAGKKYFLWGFEEPENSAEYKNQQHLAMEFKDSLCVNKQIFITTHSEEFLQLYDDSSMDKDLRRCNLYHIKKDNDPIYGDFSRIYFFDVDKSVFKFANQKSMLEEDLGQSYLRARFSKELKQISENFLKEKMQLQEENSTLREFVIKSQKPLLFVEDTYDELYKIAWLKINEIDHSKDDFANIFTERCPLTIFRAEGATNLAGLLRAKNVDIFKDKKIVGLFDFDGEGVQQFKNLKNATYWNSDIFGSKITGHYKKRNDHPNFYAMLIPIPEMINSIADLSFPSFVEIENLLPVPFLLDNLFAKEMITTGDTKYLEIKSEKKSTVWEKVLELEKPSFINFEVLFNTIYGLFNLQIANKV